MTNYQRRATDRRILRSREDNDHVGWMIFAATLTWIVAGLMLWAVWRIG